jgi:drug/metabolite transporter (DMT)-like permease
VSRNLSAYLLVTLAQLFWSGNFVLGRGLHETMPPIALSFWRWAVALLILLPFALPLLRGKGALLRRHLGILSVLAILGVTNFNTFVYVGLQTTTATNAVLTVSTTPVLIVALSFLLLGQPVSGRQGVGILVSLAGVAVIVSGGDPGSLAGLRINHGDLWVLAAVASWALYSVCLRWRPPGLAPLALLTAIVALGILPLVPLYLWELSTGRTFAPDAVHLGAVGYVALFPSVLAYVFWNRAVAELGPNRTGQTMHLMPAFGILLSALLLAERLQGFHMAGIGLIALGIWAATGGRTRSSSKP